jgi:oligoendopeptidase F
LIQLPHDNRREAAYKSLLQVYERNSGVLGEIYQNIIMQWRDEAIMMRGYRSPISVRNIANNLDDATVEALLATCRNNVAIFHDYFVEKAKMLGMKNCTDTTSTLLYQIKHLQQKVHLWQSSRDRAR